MAELNEIKELDHEIETPISAVSCDDISLAGSIFQESTPYNEKRLTVNDTGAEILNKCQLFLSGIDNENEAMSVEEHVNKMIQEATDKTSLSKMFEGWLFWI